MKTYSLIDILSKEISIENGGNERIVKFSGIKIPIIQRDYAHGRKDEEAVRTRFLGHIFKSLRKGELLELDFVYGSVQGYELGRDSKEQRTEDFFIPLDGQQRLTTLFLLYWYIGNKELVGAELDKLRNILSRFSYATRATSARFSQKLCEIELGDNPSDTIKKSIWFHDSFKQDPTVRAMLLMIEEIDRYYKADEKLFDSLENLRFYVLPLDGFDLSDELYIKMNGRGKQLTGFENFKADLVNWMSDEKNEDQVIFQEKVSYNNHLIPYYLKISSKIDNDWTNIFWKDAKAEAKEGDRVVDPAFMRFLMRFFVTRFMAKSVLGGTQVEVDTFFTMLNNNVAYRYEGLAPFDGVLRSVCKIVDLEKIVDRYALAAEQINVAIAPGWDHGIRWDLSQSGITQRQYVLFYAVMAYLERGNFEAQSFDNWIRVVWNIIIDPELRRNSTMINFIRSIDRLAEGAHDIIAFLNSEKFKLDYVKELEVNGIYNTGQLYEEHIKAVLIQKDARFLKEIRIAEAHSRLKGKIFFLIQYLENTELDTFIKDRDISFKIFRRPDLREAFRWIRASMSLNEPLGECIKDRYPLNLEDDNHDNWRNLISNELKSGISRLIKKYDGSTDIKDYVLSICSAYQLDSDNLWLYNLVSFEENDLSLLDYSESKRIVRYAFWDDNNEQKNKIYLYNKTIWTDSNIVLSNYRNQIVAGLLAENRAQHEWEHGNIWGKYFRGKIVDCVRKVNDLKITYRFELNTLKVGLLLNPPATDVLAFDILEEQRENGWIFRKKYYFGKMAGLAEIPLFLENVEQDFFDEENPQSFLNTLVRLEAIQEIQIDEVEIE